MSKESVNSERERFLSTAVRHKMLTLDAAGSIREHSILNNERVVDSARKLSELMPHQTDAIELLGHPSDLVPNHRLTELIGGGSGGLVFKARQEHSDHEVAIKTINVSPVASSNQGRRMEREARAIARLSHPGIVASHGSGFCRGRFYIIMELVSGKDLSNYIAHHPHPNERTVWMMVRQVAVALSHAHDHGIIHRDIKPGNLLLVEPSTTTTDHDDVPQIKVADFGLAMHHNAADESQITAAGTALGTPCYVAPEQLQDSRVDARSDIYSLGATLFHLFSGEPPFADYSQMRTIISKSMGNDRWREKISDSISDKSRDLFLAMTEFEIDARIKDYPELLGRIDDVLYSMAASNIEDISIYQSLRQWLKRSKRIH